MIMKFTHLNGTLFGQEQMSYNIHIFQHVVVRTLFDLSIIEESGHVDIIERLALKLQLTDRLAWNNRRGVDLERRRINDFGRLLLPGIWS